MIKMIAFLISGVILSLVTISLTCYIIGYFFGMGFANAI